MLPFAPLIGPEFVLKFTERRHPIDRRAFVRIGFYAVILGGPAFLPGCGDSSKQSGTMVKAPPEDRDSMAASAAAYRAMKKGSAPASK